MKPNELRRHIKKLEITPREFAELVGVRRQTVYRWLGGENPIDERTAKLIRMLSEQHAEKTVRA